MEVPTAGAGADRPPLILPRTPARHAVLERIATSKRPITEPGAAHTRALNDLERAGLVEIVYQPTEAGQRLLAVWDAHREHELWAQQTLASLEPDPAPGGMAVREVEQLAPEGGWWACWAWDTWAEEWSVVARGQQHMMEEDAQRRAKLLKQHGKPGAFQAAPVDQPPQGPPDTAVDLPASPSVASEAAESATPPGRRRQPKAG